VNLNIAYTLLDRLLGRRGSTVSNVDNLTEIETLLMSQLFEKSIGKLKEAWASITEIDPILEEFEVNPQFLQLVSPNETVVVVSLNTKVGETSGMINICIPHVVLEPIIPKLSVHYWMQTPSKKRDPEAFENISKNIESAILNLKTVLGESSMTIEQFIKMGKDDIIVLDKSIDEPLLLYANNEPKFYVQPGKIKNRLSVQVLDEVKGGEING